MGLKYAGENIFNNFRDLNFAGSSPITTAAFFTAFAIFFPAVTGIDAGVGMSGDLKNPRKSLVKGTFFSIGLTFIVYLIVTFIYAMVQPGMNFEQISLVNLLGFKELSIAGIFIFSGILFATSSSALSCFMTAPRTAYALAKQNVLPSFMRFLGRDFSRQGTEPRFATIFTFFIGLAVIWSGDITVASQIVGICFLIVYGWMNFSAFLERISKNPNFRPTSRGNAFISLYGFLISIAIICLFNARIGVLIIISQIIIFLLILKYKAENKLEGVWWGVLFTWIRWALQKLSKIVQGTQNWRPILTVFAFAKDRVGTLNVLRLAERIAENQGLVSANIIYTEDEKEQFNKKEQALDPDFYTIPKKKIMLKPGTSIDSAVMSIVASSNIIGIDTNTILMEYDRRINWPSLIENIINRGNKNLFIFKNSAGNEESDHIDVWWRGEKNGNMMALIAYIILNSDFEKKLGSKQKIRILRKLSEDEDSDKAREELDELILKARLNGESIIIPHDEKPITEAVKEYSFSAKLIIFGMPGKHILEKEKAGGIKKMFNFNKKFFEKEIRKFDDSPPILFVEASVKVNLIEE